MRAFPSFNLEGKTKIDLGDLRLWMRRHKFESSSLFLWAIYSIFKLTPSSYSLALQILGVEKDGLIFGTPRGIKYDEWTTGTPQLIARLIHPEIDTFYNYLPTLLDDPLPRSNLRIIFQPLSWGFLVNPALGFSLYFSTAFLLGILCWPSVFRLLGFRRSTSIIGGLSIMFSPFITGWFTHRPGIYGLLPLVILIFFKEFKYKWVKFFLSLWIGISYLETTFYPPETIVSIYFVLILILYRGDIKNNIPKYIVSLIGFTLAGIYYLLINNQIWNQYSSTLYPGKREVGSGLLSKLSIVTQFTPIGFTQSYISHFAPYNELESATFASIIIVTLAFFLNFKSIKLNDSKMLLLIVTIILVSVYEAIPGLGAIGKFFLLDKVPSNRTLLLTGLLITLLGMYLIDKMSHTITRSRIAYLFLFLIIIYTSPTLVYGFLIDDQSFLIFEKSDLFLCIATITIFVLTMNIKREKLVIQKIIVMASIPIWLVSAHWNPVSNAETFFKPVKSPIYDAITKVKEFSPNGKIAVYGFPAQILSGAGFVSLTDRPDIPDLLLLRKMFPQLAEDEFNYIFNRVAEIRINPDQFNDSPQLIQPNLITVPISKISDFAQTVTPLKFKFQDNSYNPVSVLTEKPSNLENVNFENSMCNISGWIKTSDVGEDITVIIPSDWRPIHAIRVLRPDVLARVPEAGLYSGIQISFEVSRKTMNPFIYFHLGEKSGVSWNVAQCGH